MLRSKRELAREHHIGEMSREYVATVLIVEPDMPEGISARKLVLETAKHNVITAYGGSEGLALFRRFPNVDVVFIHSELKDRDCGTVAAEIRGLDHDLPIVILSPTGQARCGDHVSRILPSHEPQALLDYLVEELNLSRSN